MMVGTGYHRAWQAQQAWQRDTKGGLYFYFACLYDHYYYYATRAIEASASLPQNNPS
jgi:hypothetical protein